MAVSKSNPDGIDAFMNHRPMVPVVKESGLQALVRRVYSAVLWLMQPAYLSRLLLRSRSEPLYRHALRQRFGFFGVPSNEPTRLRPLWVHAVSLGETRAAAALIHALREQHPGMTLLLTHGTATGWQAGAALLQPRDIQAWLPVDTPAAMAHFLDHFSPVAGVLLETEIWPNLLHQAHLRGIPMLQANARLSQRSLRKGKSLAWLIRPALQSLSCVLAQTEEDAARLQLAGVDAQHLQVFGNIKFDMTPDQPQLERGRSIRECLGRPIVLAASTREGEEGLLLQAWRSQLEGADGNLPKPLLLLVPRHPQRFQQVARCIEAQGLRMARKSELGEEGLPTMPLDIQVCLGDSMGEMAFYYAMSDVALLGGSFAPLGGQNLIEAAACGCPVVMGPHTFNFEQAAHLALAAGAAQRVEDIDAGVSVAMAVAHSHTDLSLSSKALAFAKMHRGAAYRMATRISHYITPPKIDKSEQTS